MERYTILACILIAIPSIVYSDTDPNYRLNTPIKPKSYSISITPYFDTGDDKAFSFDGEVDITFTTQNATKQIKLHSEELIFNETSITVVNGANNIELDVTNGLEFDTNYTFAFINLKTELQTGIDYSLKIVYTGPIRDDLNGFYSNYYIQNGTKKWLGATQMEPTHARKVFPCFDEPELKATFIITINRPQNYKPSLANTKLQNTLSLPNGYVREIFYPTPVMSTYLVAFMVSEFEGIVVTNASKSFGVYTRPEAINQTAYTIDFGERVVTALGQYFNIDYYSTNEHLKLDHVALPDFKAGAMENWGLVKYREALLLYVPGVSNPYYKYRVAQIVAHETTHMWFGNLVTCHWWSNTWLNEGFANYFQDYITSLIEPDIGASHMLVIGSVYSAYDADSSPESAPITNNDVNSPTEISGHFGTITYQKAGSVIRMMHHLIGDDAFKLGLHSYLTTNQFSVGYPEKMYEALDAGAKQYNSLQSYPGSSISEVMGSWISQAGHPVVEVDVHRDLKKMVLSQKRFYIDSSHTSNEIYSIPISYTTQKSPNFDDTKPVIIMANKTIEVNLPDINADTWILLNIQETGLYRVSYDDQTYDLISKALKSSERKNIHHLNRAKIVNDLFAFLYCNEVKFNRIHDVLEFMTDETEYTVWYAAIKGLNKLYNSYLGTDASDDIKNYALKILNPIVSTVLYNQNEGEEFEETRNRMQVLEFACKLEHAGCIEYAVKLFRELRDEGKEITPSLRPVAYCTGLRHGNGDDYEFLWNRMKTTNYAGEARVISDVLGCTNVEEKLKSYLVSSLEENSPIRIQDVTAPLTSILADYSHLDFVLEQLKTNYTLWTTIYPSMDPVVTLIASNLHTDQDFTEFQSFLDSCTECSAELKTAAQKTVTQAKTQASWARSHMEDIIANLRSSGAIVAPSLLLVCSLALLADFSF